jgi:hypothetical protein
MDQSTKAVPLYRTVTEMPVRDHRDPYWQEQARKRLQALEKR